MAEGKKYNAFSGVFTPSLLTILGVIMYMRLGWVVGEAGLIAAIGIIILAHVISITTGLSISSIATDKKIKTGGIYYILSRSLGMPMGGAIGIALFIGTALSISLYLIGFAESFLAIDAVRELTGLSANINGFRIIGTIVIIILSVIAFISTSLAMRVQFLILIAIALSLLSIILGFFNSPTISVDSISYFHKGNIPLEYIFAIFFPAVTGFTAGVAMSGDLQDPKRDIPRGTIMAIGIGFIIYILLAIGMAYFIPKGDLTSNYNILKEIAYWSPLVIAGIWGATLSSALGGILGGPRILQAIAKDKMSPKLFGKGYGENNEPRNALLLIFAIAEGGILIGKLDAIAEIVSMFYLASYGFINLSYVLEKWSSSDFRPTFKIHIAFGIIGFIASFAVMFKLNIAAMFASLFIMGLLYITLKRKEIRSENGDVWQSVLGTIIRKALTKMQGKSIEDRNWKPNIILFSGSTTKRAHLLRFGKSIIGKYGILSNFDLHEKKDSKVLFTKYEQNIKEESDDDRGIFTRRQSCNNIYEGIETIAQTYGFSGVEPNTVLMGWGRHTQNPMRFVQMINHLSHLDLNILLLDYDKLNGFGNKKQIDIWWRGSSRHGNLSLTLIKFLSNSEDWNQANIRLLIVNYENHKMEMIRKRTEEYLDNIRIDAEIKIINNEIERKPFYDIMKAESYKSDLVFLGIPDIKKGEELEFIERTNNLMHNIGSVVLVKASSLFKALNLGISGQTVSDNLSKSTLSTEQTQREEINIKWPKNVVSAHETRLLHHEIIDNFELHTNILFKQIHKDNEGLIQNIEEIFLQALQSIEQRYDKLEKLRQIQLLSRHRSNLLVKVHRLMEQYNEHQLVEQSQLLETHLPIFTKNLRLYFSNLPQKLLIYYSKDDLKKSENDSASQKRYKFWKRLLGAQQIKYKLQYKRIVEENMLIYFEPFIVKFFKTFGLNQVQFSVELRKLVKSIDNSFISLVDKINKDEDNTLAFQHQKEEVLNTLNEIRLFNTAIQDKLVSQFYRYQAKKTNSLSHILDQIHPNSKLISEEEEDAPKKKSLSPIIEKIPSAWSRNQLLINNASITEVRLISLKSKIKTILYKLAEDIKLKLQKEVVDVYRQFLIKLDNPSEIEYINDFKELNSMAISSSISSIYDEGNRAFNRSFVNMPDQIEVFEDEKLNDFAKAQFTDIESSEISAKQLIDYLIKNKIEAPLVKQLENISKTTIESIASLNDSKRLISFALAQQEDIADELFDENPIDILKDAKLKINNELDKIEDLLREIGLETDHLFTDVSQLLSYYSFVKTASNLKQYIHQQKTQSRLDLFKSKLKRWAYYLKEQQANLIYTQSKALVLKKELETQNELNNPVKQLLDLSYQLTPNNQVMNTLPFYYKQLFSSNNQILHKDFWVGRAEEIRNIQTSVQQYLSGHKGVIAVVGQTGIGKSFFAHYASTLLNVPKIISVQVLFENTPSKSDIDKAICNAIGKEGNVKDVLDKLPKNSLIIFENIELWWKSFSKDDALIQYLFNLISDYHDQFIFVVISNEIAFKMMIENTEYYDLFLNIIKLRNVDSRHIKDIILNRHRASGLKLKMDHKLFNDWSKTKLAYLFNKIYKITDGNIEAALQLWLTSIYRFDKETVELRLPNLSIKNLNVLDIDSRVILKQFVIHKQLTLEHLADILQEEPSNLNKKIMFLIRSGLLSKYKNYYQQNKFTKYYVVRFLTEKGMI